jgi:hypothetical protein
MSGVSAGLNTTIELRGHLIDSLTLSKVIDIVQQLGGDYRLNDIRVGNLKKDISSINMTLMASTPEVLAQLIEAIAPYGAMPGDQEQPETLICEQEGVLPKEAYSVKLPQRVHHDDQWILVENGGTWALILEQGQPRMKPVNTLRKGDILISGTHGLQW